MRALFCVFQTQKGKKKFAIFSWFCTARCVFIFYLYIHIMCVLFYCAVACYLYIQRSLLFAIYTYEFFYHAPKKLATFATFKNSTSGGRHARVAVLTPLMLDARNTNVNL